MSRKQSEYAALAAMLRQERRDSATYEQMGLRQLSASKYPLQAYEALDRLAGGCRLRMDRYNMLGNKIADEGLRKGMKP